MSAAIVGVFGKVSEGVKVNKRTLTLGGMALGAWVIKKASNVYQSKEERMRELLASRLFIYYRTAAGKAAGRALYFLTFLFRNRMDSYQALLPTLPVPDLHSSLKKWFASVSPLLSGAELVSTLGMMDTFRKGVGQIGQAGLIQYAKGCVNYVTEAWLDKYLSTSPPLHQKDSWVGIGLNAKTDDPLRQTTLMIAGEWHFREQIRNKTLSPFYMGDDAHPLPVCMDQMNRLHGVQRIPGELKDHMQVTKHSKHVIFMCEEQMFEIKVEKADGSPFSHSHIYSQLVAARNEAKSSKEKAVGRLTAMDRRSLFPLYSELKALNPEALTCVEEAISVYSLDEDEMPLDNHDAAKMCFLNQHNRWFNSGANRVFGTNGLGGGIYEHTYTEATAEAQQHTAVNKYASDFRDEKLTVEEISVRPLHFETNREIDQAIEHMPKKHTAFKVHCQRMPLGKDHLKTLKMSPDAVVQMAILQAYHALTGNLTSVYESGMTRLFKQGRTDTITTLSAEAKRFIEEPSLSRLRGAVIKHKKTTNEALDGKGHDRHLMMLKWFMGNADMDTRFFESTAYQKSQDMKISSSTTPTKDAMGGFPPPSTENGIGCSYIMQDGHMDFTLSGADIDPEAFYAKLEEKLRAILTLS